MTGAQESQRHGVQQTESKGKQHLTNDFHIFHIMYLENKYEIRAPHVS
jgi:hypothetical protein